MVNLTQLLSVGIDAVVTVLEKWGVTGLNINFDFQASENLISRLLMWIYGWMGNYGWTIILFTVVLRLITLPLDFWQKFSMKKNSKIMEEITPIMTKIDKAYGDNVQAANAEKQKIMKKYRYNPAASCLPMLVTMVVFIIMFSGLNNCSSALNIKTYQSIQEAYLRGYYSVITDETKTGVAILDNEGNEILNKDGQPTTLIYYAECKNNKTTQNENEFTTAQVTALNAAYNAVTTEAEYKAKRDAVMIFSESGEGFLWIKSLWRSDNWQKVLPDNATKFASTLSGNKDVSGLTSDVIYDSIYDAFTNPDKYFDTNDPVQAEQLVKAKKSLGYGKGMWNGLLILPVLAIALTWLTTRINSKNQGTVGTGAQLESAQKQQKTMAIIMPLMMGIFALFYSAAFALYLVASNAISILFNLIETPLVNKMAEKTKSVIKNDVSYRR
ncbi:MAG: membrane protein insertase YidC [Eubacteriales bacterium]|nr:membrane protein insertase YidC [Eubacteriales bacterium]